MIDQPPPPAEGDAPAPLALDPAPLPADGSPPRLIAFDWGTSNLRAFLLADDGLILQQRRRPWGILRLPDRSVTTHPDPATTPFEAAIAGIAGDWIDRWPDLRLLASGMVGSRQGWREAPYLPLPVRPGEIARARIEVEFAHGRRLAILPGLCQGADPATSLPLTSRPLTSLPLTSRSPTSRSPTAASDRPAPTADVMRGEETQVVGALARLPALADDGWLVLPGTHSKWVRVRDGRLVAFSTHLTGELYDLLSRHSILAQSTGAASEGPTLPLDHSEEMRGFHQGVTLAAAGEPSLPNLLFGIRARHLLHRTGPAFSRGLLSGILIGHEIGAASIGVRRSLAPLVLVGEPALCLRYEQALALLGLTPRAVLDNTAAEGLHRLGQALDAIDGDR